MNRLFCRRFSTVAKSRVSGIATVTVTTPRLDVTTVKEGEVAKFVPETLKEGDPVEEHQLVMVYETVKVAIDINSPVKGVIHKLLVKPKDTVPLPGHPLFVVRIS